MRMAHPHLFMPPNNLRLFYKSKLSFFHKKCMNSVKYVWKYTLFITNLWYFIEFSNNF